MERLLNKIIQSDALEYLKSIPSETVSAALVDEPYMLLKGHKIEEGYSLDIAKEVRLEIMRVLKKDGWFVFFSQFPMAWEFGRVTMEAGFKPWRSCNEIVWCKRQSSNPYLKLLRIHENIFVFTKGDPKVYENKAPYEDDLVPRVFNGISCEETLHRYFAALRAQAKTGCPATIKVRSVTKGRNDPIYETYRKKGDAVLYGEFVELPSIWCFVSENKMHFNSHNIKHPTVKPTLLLRRLCKLFTLPGDTVLDCFAGSGTTLLAAVQEGRNFIGCERDPEYFKIAQERLLNWKEDLARQEAWLANKDIFDFQSDVKTEDLFDE